MNKRKIIISLIIIIILLPALIFLYFFRRVDHKVEIVDSSEKYSTTLSISNINNTDFAFEEIVEIFTSRHPNIRIEINSYPRSAYYNIVKTSISSGIGPDLFELESINLLNSYITRNSVLDLTELISLEWLPNEVMEYCCSLDGRIYATPPLSKRHHVLFYNKDLFRRFNISEDPKIKTQLIKDCEKLASAGISPIAFGGKDLESLKNIAVQLSPYSEKGFVPSQFEALHFNDLAVIIEKLKSYFPTEFHTMDYDDAKLLFVNQNAAMFFGTDDLINEFKKSAGFEVSTTFVYGERNYKSFYNYSGSYAVNINTSNRVGASEFIKYLSSPETIDKYNEYLLKSFYVFNRDISLPQYPDTFLLDWMYMFDSEDIIKMNDYFEKMQLDIIK